MKSKETRDVVLSLLESLIAIDSESHITNDLPVPQENPSQKASTLSEDEWKLILGSECDSCVEFMKGDYVIHEGCTYRTLFQTASGSYSVERLSGGIREDIGTVEVGEVLGEINFFTQQAASASVVVTSESAEVFLINSEYLLNDLLKSHPNVVAKFYYHICYLVGSRLTRNQ